MNTTVYTRWIFVFILGCILLAPAFTEGTPEKAGTADIDSSATVSYIEGDVFIDNKPADFGQIVEIGAVVRTGSSSLCDINFGTANIFRIEADTITKISIGPENREIEIEKGGIQAVFDKLKTFGTGTGDFAVRTPSAIAGIRGTVFYIRVENPRSTYFCTCHGTIRQGGRGESEQKDVSAYHHKAYRYTKSGDTVTVEQGTLLYHDDAMMDALAAKIGVTIPWDKYSSGY